jgi:TPR repeat protein
VSTLFRTMITLLVAIILSACSIVQDTENERAKEAYRAGDYQQALATWSRLAEKGNAKAQNNMGVLYSEGHGVERDNEMALAWFTKAAEQGFVLAQANLGDSYFNGDIVPQDYGQAAYWYTLGARGGDGESQFYMGKMLADGLGMPRDPARAHMWYSIAAMNGYEDADAALEDLETTMSQQDLNRAEALLSVCMGSALTAC